MIRKVPKEFVLGAAMSAYQMEGAAAVGGREPSVWEDWLRRTVPAARRHTSDFYHHYEEDIAACAAKGIRALSLSFSWSRIMWRDGTVNPEGLAFYDRVIDACLRHGVEPFVALYHFDLPADLAPAGWLAPQTVEAYLRYARVCFRHFGARVRHWLTLKDPMTEVTQGYLTGLFPPGQQLALGRAVLALHKMLTVLAQAARVLDFFGVNYYASHFCTRPAPGGESRIIHNATGTRGTSTYELAGVSRRVTRADVPTTDWDWNIFPHGLYEMLRRIHRGYREIPLYVTETGIGLHDSCAAGGIEDDDRIDYLRQHLAAVLDAREDGVDVRGLFVWSLLDGLSWANGCDKRYGLFYVDYETGERTPKKSADWFGDLAHSRLMLTTSSVSNGLLV